MTRWELAAQEFGREAATNGRPQIVTLADRQDIASFHSAGFWLAMPEQDRNRAIDLFYEEYRKSKRGPKL